MLNPQRGISRYQLLCLGFLALLSPIIRVLPRQVAGASGSGAWLTAILTLIPVGLLFLLVMRFFKNAHSKEGFSELFVRSLGKKLGKAVILLICLWLILYAGFSLRSSAERYISSAYQHGSSMFFIIVMLVLAMLAALGRFKTLARTAEALLPMMAFVLVLVFAFAFKDIDPLFLPPVTIDDTRDILSGIPMVANIISISVYIGFIEGQVTNKAARGKTIAAWLLLMLFTIVMILITTIGSFGQQLTSELSYPFFVMIRNISITSFIERMDALVISLWVITDFVLISLLLFIVVGNLRFCLNFPGERAENQKLFKMGDGRYLVWLVGILVFLAAVFVAPDSFVLTRLSRFVVPIVNLAFTFGLLPLVIFIGLARKKI